MVEAAGEAIGDRRPLRGDPWVCRASAPWRLGAGRAAELGPPMTLQLVLLRQMLSLVPVLVTVLAGLLVDGWSRLLRDEKQEPPAARQLGVLQFWWTGEQLPEGPAPELPGAGSNSPAAGDGGAAFPPWLDVLSRTWRRVGDSAACCGDWGARCGGGGDGGAFGGRRLWFWDDGSHRKGLPLPRLSSALLAEVTAEAPPEEGCMRRRHTVAVKPPPREESAVAARVAASTRGLMTPW